MDQRAFFKTVSALADGGRPSDALQLLRTAIRRNELDSQGIDRAGARCRALFEAAGEKAASRVLLLGQCTTTWLVSALTAYSWADGRAIDVVDGAYDSVLQELLVRAEQPALPDVVVLLPWHQRLLSLGSSRTPEERVQDELSFWGETWALVEKRIGARIVQVGYDWITPGPLGFALSGRPDGTVGVIRTLNDRLRRQLPAGAMFVDLEQISGESGRRGFYDARRYHWTKQPFSEQGTCRLAQHLAASIRALVTGPKKVVVVDLDNTLWGGVVGEEGPLGISLGETPDGEAFVALQRHLKQLKERGVLLAVCSKNNEADAREPFTKNPNMVLSLDDFAQFEASWDPKTEAIRRIAGALQLGVDSFVFVDDNPAEREQVRQGLPEVAVVELPEDPAEYVRALDAGLWFEAVDITAEDRVRAAQYRSERERREETASFDTIDEYLKSLRMVADIRPIDEADMDRVVQLVGKTNQFNLTTRRHGRARIQQMLQLPGTIALTLRLSDRFGDHGLVSVLIALRDENDPTALVIDTWLMSCRVINRTVEQHMFNLVVETALHAGFQRLIGVFIPTPKNALVENMYAQLGFTPRARIESTVREFELDLRSASAAETFVNSAALAL